MTKAIIAVSGFGRCGSSLVMQMLAAAGVPMTGRAPAYEAEEAGFGRERSAFRRWLADHRGHAVKILDPQVVAPPSGIDYRVIWLRRDRWQQARSCVKFAEAFRPGSVETSHRALHKLAVSYERDEPRALEIWRSRTKDIAALDFECLIKEPVRVASVLCRYLGLVESPSRLRAMEMVVQPRSADCYPGLLEVELLAQHPGEA